MESLTTISRAAAVSPLPVRSAPAWYRRLWYLPEDDGENRPGGPTRVELDAVPVANKPAYLRTQPPQGTRPANE